MEHITDKINTKTLIYGCGGGYDIYTCLYWYLKLTPEQKEKCILANYSFTKDNILTSNTFSESSINIFRIDKDIKLKDDYFPEYYLSEKLNTPIYAVSRLPNPLLETELEKFIVDNEIKQIILADGGVDAMLHGNEMSFGSPLEDSQSVVACTNIAKKLDIKCYLVCSALYIDDVEPHIFTSNWKVMEKNENLECKKILIEKDGDFDFIKEIVRHPPISSIINESIISAVDGVRGKDLDNQRLKNRIKEDNDYPDIYDDTCYLWWINCSEFVKVSKYYQELLKLHVEPNTRSIMWSTQLNNIYASIEKVGNL